jgi:hypothetical protein
MISDLQEWHTINDSHFSDKNASNQMDYLQTKEN